MKKTLFLLTLVATSLILTQSATALSGGDFNAGRIMDDGVFFNKNTMDIGTIQAFLNSKMPNCDTWGQQPRGNTTRAAYGTSVGYPPPYICLKDYRTDTVAKPYESGLCNGYGVGNQSAAEIIYNVSQTCGINPQVLIVLLQKEQSLLTDDWPWSIQYRSATGYGCPDTAPCDAEYYGYFNQVYMAARQFKRYARDSSLFRYRAYRDNYVQYNPNVDCGGSTIYIHNQATAGLYNYTPYQPNVAALNNLYGTGDGCSAYGNRNFWRLYHDWFGSGFRENSDILVTTPIAPSNPTPRVGEQITLSYTVQNKGGVPLDSGVLWICTSLNGNAYGSGSIRKVLAPNETLTVSMPYTPAEVGTLQLVACGNTPNGPGWVAGYPYAVQSNDRETYYTVRQNGIRISAAIAPSTASPVVGQSLTASYTVKNIDTIPTNTGILWVCASINGKPMGGPGFQASLNPGQTLTVSHTFTLYETGTLQLTACGNTPNGPGWVAGYPYADYADHRERTITVNKSPLLVVAAIAPSNVNPSVGEQITLSYIVQNKGSVAVDSGVLWICTSLNGKAFGSGANRKILAPNETLTISMPFTPSETGSLEMVACGNTPNGPGWVAGYPYAAYADHSARTITVNKSPILVVAAIAPSNISPRVGEQITISYIVQNKGTGSVDSGVLWVCTSLNGKAYGSGSNRKVLAANETLTISMPFTPSEHGSLQMVACGNTPNGPGWVAGYPYAAYADHSDRTITVRP